MNHKINLWAMLLLVICGCSRIENKEIRKSWWLYGGGYHLSDALRFDESTLKGDTIYEQDKAVAVILDCSQGIFRNSAVLEIQSLATGEKGTYHDKGPK